MSHSSPVLLLILLLAGSRPVLAENNHFEPFFFAFSSDAHISSFDNTIDVRLGQMRQQINAIKPAFVVMAGDLLNESTPSLFTKFKLTTQGYDVPYYVIPGNHDIDPVKFPAATLAAYRQHMGPDYYRVTHKNCDFYFLNSVVMRDRATYGAEYDAQWEWLQNSVAQTTGRAHVFFVTHHPPFLDRPTEGGGNLVCCGGGYFNWPPAERSMLLSLLSAARGTVMFAGHFHRDRIVNHSGYTIHIPTGPQLDFDHGPTQQQLTWRLIKVFGYRIESIRMIHGATDSTPPATPHNIRAFRVTNGSIQVECDAATDNTGVLYYDLYLNGAKIRRSIEPVILATVPAGEVVREFMVRAIDPYGNESAASSALLFEDSPLVAGSGHWAAYE